VAKKPAVGKAKPASSKPASGRPVSGKPVSGQSSNPNPIALHMNLTLLEVADPSDLNALMADARVGPLIAARLSNSSAIIVPDKTELLLKALKDGGHTPKIVRPETDRPETDRTETDRPETDRPETGRSASRGLA
jgi:hypothetical protein